MPKIFFPCSRGIRQTDPLSSFLVILVMKCLSLLISLTDFCRLFSYLHQDAKFVIFLKFCMRIRIIISNPCQTNLKILRCVLFCFRTASGLRVNHAKNAIISVGVAERRDNLATTFLCKVEFFPTIYLNLLWETIFTEACFDWGYREIWETTCLLEEETFQAFRLICSLELETHVCSENVKRSCREFLMVRVMRWIYVSFV